MVLLPKREEKVSELIYKLYEDTAKDWRRPHLGASIIGRDCSREIWYMFRWTYERRFEGRMLRLFSRGDDEERKIVKELRRLKQHGVYEAIEVWEKSPDTGKQFRVTYMGGHFGGSCDGIILGIPAAKKTPHLLEFKTSNAKNFTKLNKSCVKEAKPEHYAQMQVYMHGLRLDRALYIAVCKDDDRIYEERVEYDRVAAAAILKKAEAIVKSESPPARIHEDPTFWKCKFCDFKEACFGTFKEPPEINCRTCAHVTPLDDGSWKCDVHLKSLTVPMQKKACQHHVFNPSMMEPSYGRGIWNRPTDPKYVVVEYEDGTCNGYGHLSSEAIRQRDCPS